MHFFTSASQELPSRIAEFTTCRPSDKQRLPCLFFLISQEMKLRQVNACLAETDRIGPANEAVNGFLKGLASGRIAGSLHRNTHGENPTGTLILGGKPRERKNLGTNFMGHLNVAHSNQATHIIHGDEAQDVKCRSLKRQPVKPCCLLKTLGNPEEVGDNGQNTFV